MDWRYLTPPSGAFIGSSQVPLFEKSAALYSRASFSDTDFLFVKIFAKIEPNQTSMEHDKEQRT